MIVCVRACVCVHVCESTLVLPCLLLSDATSNFVSWATRGPCYVFSLPVLAGNENQLLCCCHRSGGGLFSFYFHPWYLPIHSYRRNKSNSNSISIYVSFLQWFNVAFFFYSTAQHLPTNTLATNELLGTWCDISEEELYKSRDEEEQICRLRYILYGAPKLLSPARTGNMSRSTT